MPAFAKLSCLIVNDLEEEVWGPDWRTGLGLISFEPLHMHHGVCANGCSVKDSVHYWSPFSPG